MKQILQIGPGPVAKFFTLEKNNGSWFIFKYNEKQLFRPFNISGSAHLYATQTFPLSEFPKNKGKKTSTRPSVL